MPDLPTLSVTQAQANYLLDHFGSVEAYKAWLLEQIKKDVMAAELLVARQDAQEYVEQKRLDLQARLDGISVT